MAQPSVRNNLESADVSGHLQSTVYIQGVSAQYTNHVNYQFMLIFWIHKSLRYVAHTFQHRDSYISSHEKFQYLTVNFLLSFLNVDLSMRLTTEINKYTRHRDLYSLRTHRPFSTRKLKLSVGFRCLRLIFHRTWYCLSNQSTFKTG